MSTLKTTLFPAFRAFSVCSARAPQYSRALPIHFPRRIELLSIPSQRFNSTLSIPKPLTDRSDSLESSSKSTRPPQPEYKITFTCRPCGDRSTHTISKQGYHHGSVLISCPGCKNRHIISDHLKIFSDKSLTIEDLMRERGQLVKKGTLSEDGNMEFWEDGTTTPHTEDAPDEKA